MTTGDAERWSARTGHDMRRAHRIAPRLTGAATVLLCGVLLAACSGSTGGQASSTTRSRPAGPTADLSHELTPGNRAFVGSATAVDLGQAGYVPHENVASRDAASADQKGPLTSDGPWAFAPS